MARSRRVVITGLGVVNGAVTGGMAALEAFLAGVGVAGIGEAGTGTGVARIGEAGAGTGVAPAREPVPPIDAPARVPVPLIHESEARRLSRVCQLAVAATRLAVTDAGLADAGAAGFVVGTEFGDLRSTIDFADGYLASGPGGLSALLFPNTVMNAMAAATTIAVGAKQLSLTLNVATVGGELAIARAAASIAGGRVDVVIAGGVDELDPRVEERLAAVGAAPQVRGEGAAFVVLEAEDRARARGATVYAGIDACAWRALPARPHGIGRVTASRAIGAALERAGRGAADIGAVYVSASGDAARDAWEARVLDAALAPHRPPRAATAALVGAHAGVGAVAVGAAAWRVRNGGNVARPPLVLVHGLARGGTHVALLIASAR